MSSPSILKVIPQPSLISKTRQKSATSGQKNLFVTMLHFGSDVYREYRIGERLREKRLAADTNDAWNLFMQMLTFLWLAEIRPRNARWSPPARIDAVWHEFILFTEAYAIFCEKSVGHFIHHVPITSVNRNKKDKLKPWLHKNEKKEQFCGSEIPFMPRYWQLWAPRGEGHAADCTRCRTDRPCDGGGH